ncbi:MAG: phage shock protein A [Thermomicrobiales bacterium]|nr:MAG: phage shock protein A [Thermomicrobiales bacterium]
MGIMDRLSRLIRANINDLIDRAEDPEKMIDQILRDMESSIQQARQQVAAMIAQEKELEADLAETQNLANEWANKAKRAVEAGKDDLAREALRRKRDNESNAALYEQQLSVQRQAVDKLKEQLRQLEAKYQATLSQRDSLLARQRRARAQQKVAATLSSFSPLDPTADLERMERKIRGDEARAAALVEMGDESFEAQFRELEEDGDIEAELQALKSGMGGSAAALPESSGQEREQRAQPPSS